MTSNFGWTTDPAILALFDGEVFYSADHDILSNRKDGGVHRVWTWPLGHFDDDSMEEWHAHDADPCWSRVDVAWGRHLTDGCTFLVWEECDCRPGMLEDASLFIRGINSNTPRTQRRDENERRYRERVDTTPAALTWSDVAVPTNPAQPSAVSGYTPSFAFLLTGNNRAERRAAAKAARKGRRL